MLTLKTIGEESEKNNPIKGQVVEYAKFAIKLPVVVKNGVWRRGKGRKTERNVSRKWNALNCNVILA